MGIDRSILSHHLGKKFDPKADYVVEHAHLAPARTRTGECKMVGLIETAGDGPMAILCRVPQTPRPEKKGLKGWLNKR